MRPQLLVPELLWQEGELRAGLAVAVDREGRIEAVLPAARAASMPEEVEVALLPGAALLPGFVNAHSHAFQRGLRGRGETFPAGAGSFWTWREAMYSLVDALTPDGLYELSRQAFAEMLAAGITTVGEFHYLHHPAGAEWAGDAAVLAAARDAGIRIVLLQAYYKTGSIGQPLQGGQLRFETRSLAEYWQQMDRLAGLLDTSTQSLGVVAHSIRAVPLAELTALAAEARRQGLPFHIHIEEQRQEIEECRAAYGKRPMELLLGLPGGLEGVTAIHGTHTRPQDLERFAERGGRLCVCPTTEANLGDGLPALHLVPAIHPRLCLGTDSNSRISMLEEMRWLEYGQRLRSETRGVLRDESGDLAAVLLDIATHVGSSSLDLDAGAISPGRWADLVHLDLRRAELANHASTAAHLVAGADERAVAATMIGGRRPSS